MVWELWRVLGTEINPADLVAPRLHLSVTHLLRRARGGGITRLYLSVTHLLRRVRGGGITSPNSSLTMPLPCAH